MFNPQTNQTTKWTSRLGIGICVLSLGGMVGMILGVMTLREQPNRLAGLRPAAILRCYWPASRPADNHQHHDNE